MFLVLRTYRATFTISIFFDRAWTEYSICYISVRNMINYTRHDLAKKLVTKHSKTFALYPSSTHPKVLRASE